MDEMARQSNINFSQELQNAIKEKLQTDRNPQTSAAETEAPPPEEFRRGRFIESASGMHVEHPMKTVLDSQ